MSTNDIVYLFHTYSYICNTLFYHELNIYVYTSWLCSYWNSLYWAFSSLTSEWPNHYIIISQFHLCF